MKNIIYWLLLLLPFGPLKAQSVITEFVDNKGFHFKVITLGAHINNGKYEKAINSQLGIFGKDYYHPDTIGTAPAEQGGVVDTWYPITLDKGKRASFKTTCVGILREGYKRRTSGTDEFLASLIGKEADDDWNFYVLPKNDIIAKINMYENKSNIKHGLVYYEIDVPDYFKGFFSGSKSYAPKIFTPLAAYGPLVTDQGHGPPYAVEIHPAEQIWWTKQTPGKITHYLISISDASGRFNDRDDYDAKNYGDTSPTFKGIWQKVPQESIYAIPFFTGGKQKEVITVRELTSFETVAGGFIISADAKAYDAEKAKKMRTSKHFLTYGRDTILQVNYIGSCYVSFHIDNFGFDPYYKLKYNVTAYKGFLVMRSQVKTYKGHQVHAVERVNKNQHLNKPFEYTFDIDVNITSITCDDLGDDNSPEKSIEVTGMIGIISQAISQTIGAGTPSMNNDNLLANYTNKIIVKKGEKKTLNTRKTITLHENEEFYLRVLLQEGVDSYTLSVVPGQSLNGTEVVKVYEPKERIDGEGPTIRGASLYFYKLNEPQKIFIKGEGTHKTGITFEGSITVRKKIKRLPFNYNSNASF